MSHNEQEHIDLREPVACWQKVLLSIFSVLGLAVVFSFCRGAVEETHTVAILVGLVITAVPTLFCTLWAMYFWWGKKYLVFNGNAMVIYRQLLWFKQSRCVVTGRKSRLVMRRESHVDHHDGGCSTHLLLLITDAYGHSYRLLQYSPSQKERMVAIGQEICRHFPELKWEQED
ncbi:MAG: hypothetical protein IKL98_04600 [Akkermansia sp.]|nr:hypothetical protein [Akkermansia sp.]